MPTVDEQIAEIARRADIRKRRGRREPLNWQLYRATSNEQPRISLEGWSPRRRRMSSYEDKDYMDELMEYKDRKKHEALMMYYMGNAKFVFPKYKKK